MATSGSPHGWPALLGRLSNSQFFSRFRPLNPLSAGSPLRMGSTSQKIWFPFFSQIPCGSPRKAVKRNPKIPIFQQAHGGAWPLWLKPKAEKRCKLMKVTAIFGVLVALASCTLANMLFYCLWLCFVLCLIVLLLLFCFVFALFVCLFLFLLFLCLLVVCSRLFCRMGGSFWPRSPPTGCRGHFVVSLFFFGGNQLDMGMSCILKKNHGVCSDRFKSPKHGSCNLQLAYP